MALAYTNITVELREISLKDRPPELYEVSKKGTVPVLITKDNIVIDESLEIMLWALKNNIKMHFKRLYKKIASFNVKGDGHFESSMASLYSRTLFFEL